MTKKLYKKSKKNSSWFSFFKNKKFQILKKHPSVIVSAISISTVLLTLMIVSLEIVQTPNHLLISGKAIAAMNPLLTVTPLPPTPTLTPTPSVEPTPVYTGYCLNVPVLMYHHTAPGSIAQARSFSSLNVDNGFFDQQMGYIASHGFTPIFAEDLINALISHTALPPKSIVVTLDDGYDDVYNYAFPIIRKYGIKMSLMVPTGLLGVNTPTNSYYTWGQLQEMVNSGLARAYNHTFSHYSMGSGGDGKDVSEMTTAQTQLQQQIGHTVGVFAYPYGTNALSGHIHDELRANGFTGAFSTIYGTYQCDAFIMSLHRTRIGNSFFPAFGIF